MKKLFVLFLAALMTLSCTAVLADQVLSVATNPEFPPFEYVEGDDVVGLDMDIAAEIAKDLGWELNIVSMNFDSTINEVVSGKCDVAITGLTINAERRLTVDFSTSYYNARQACIVRKGGKVQDADTLKNKLIGVQLGTTGDLAAENFTAFDKVMRYNKALDAVLELQGGKLDAVIIDLPVAQNLLASLGDENLYILDNIPFEDEFFGIAVKKGNTELLTAVNATLDRIMNDGTYAAIIAKYFASAEEAAE